jgi:hypothetical protein
MTAAMIFGLTANKTGDMARWSFTCNKGVPYGPAVF